MDEKKPNEDKAMLENLDLLLAMDVLEEEENWDLAQEVAEDSENMELFEKMSEEGEEDENES